MGAPPASQSHGSPRIREVQRLGGSSDVLAFSDRDEDAELLEGHFDFLCDSIVGMDPSGGKSAAPQFDRRYDYTKQNLLLEVLVRTGYFPFQPTAADARHGWKPTMRNDTIERTRYREAMELRPSLAAAWRHPQDRQGPHSSALSHRAVRFFDRSAWPVWGWRPRPPGRIRS